MLEKRTYTIQELSDIIGTADKAATDKKLERYRIAFTSKGRGKELTYTITDIPDRFKVFCVFDLGFDPHTDFTKLRDFLFYLLGDDDFNWRPMEMMEEYLRIAGKGMSRQTISKYIKKIESLHLVTGTDFVYYRVHKNFGVQVHEIITKEEYSKAWRIYWEARERGYDSKAAYSCMYNAFQGVPRKQRKLEPNALCQDTLSLLSDLISESFLLENNG